MSSIDILKQREKTKLTLRKTNIEQSLNSKRNVFNLPTLNDEMDIVESKIDNKKSIQNGLQNLSLLKQLTSEEIISKIQNMDFGEETVGIVLMNSFKIIDNNYSSKNLDDVKYLIDSNLHVFLFQALNLIVDDLETNNPKTHSNLVFYFIIY